MLMFIISEIENETDQKFMINLYENHGDLMFKISRKSIFEEDFVEDVVQESLLKLYRNISTIKQLERCKLEAYIVFTVKHTAYNHNRKMKLDKQHLTFDDDDSLISLLRTSDRCLEDDLLKKEKRLRMKAILKKLPEKDQDIIIRKYYLQQNDAEIAEAHGLKASSVRMRLTRIRRRFFDTMSEEGVIYEIT